MPITKIYSFLTYPRNNAHSAEDILGAEVKIDASKLCLMLSSLYTNANKDCDTPILFTSPGETQANEVRDLLCRFVQRPSLKLATPFAERLQKATTGASGMGLLFICVGKESGSTHVMISRFPADEGVVAEKQGGSLSVNFVEQVFLKNAHAYKAATYKYSGKADDLWEGFAIDRQINNSTKQIADYWIVDFLCSDFKTTAAAGTRRLAAAIKDVLNTSGDSAVVLELTSAINLAANLGSEAMTVEGFCRKYSLSDKAIALIKEKIKPSRLIADKFRFDKNEFLKHIAFKQVELSNGAYLTAPASRFDECFVTKQQKDGSLEFVTIGSVVSERMRAKA